MAESERNRTLLAPTLILVFFAIAGSLLTWNAHDTGDDLAPALQPHSHDEISAVEAADIALQKIADATDNGNSDHIGLLSGQPTSVLARYEHRSREPLWTVVVRGPVRSRPNTEAEFTIELGEIVVQVSAITGEVAGEFAAGRAATVAGGGVIGSLHLGHDGFIDVALRHVAIPQPSPG